MSGEGSAGRVIAGTARGTRLAAPGEGTRPLADRVKQTLFAILEPDLRGANILDLFAGSGAAGIEGLSRGATAATFVERDQGALATIRANLERTHLMGPAVRLERAEVVGWLAGPRARASAPYDIVVLDPPYDRPELVAAALSGLARGDLVAPTAWVVAKHFWRDAPPSQVGLLASVRERRFGETALTFYRPGEPLPESEEEVG